MARQLTNAQRAIAYEKKGLFAVMACPGSGKTFSVAARLAHLLSHWRRPHVGIAVLSFTNVAWQEIEVYLAEEFNVRVPLGYPHFLGTIDSFLNRFIFLPHGSLVMGWRGRPELMGPPHNDLEPIGHWLYWRNAECHRNGCQLNDFSYGDDGSLVHLSPRSHFANCQSNHAQCLQHKRTFTARGYATQSDANYFASALLQRYPAIARALAVRFPVMMIDEAQDTSRIQMQIVDALLAGGVRELMLIGDPRQAIYEWRGADPSLFQNKFEEWRANSVEMNENWRSTRSICALACRLGTPAAPMVASNPDLVEHDEAPQFYGYGSDAELQDAFERFKAHCRQRGLDAAQISVLSRSGSLVNVLLPGAIRQELVPWREDDPFTRHIAHAKYLLDRGNAKGGLRLVERAAFHRAKGHSAFRMAELADHAMSVGVDRWQGSLFAMLKALPNTDGLPISEWVQRANGTLDHSKWFQGHTLALKQDRRPNVYSALTFSDVFAAPEPSARDSAMTGTIHSAKGRSLEAVFLALKTRGASGPSYTNLLATDLLQEEELRIIYVAVTRARKVLGIAVPANSLRVWRRLLDP